MTLHPFDKTLPMRCARCGDCAATRVVGSYSVLTVRCTGCGHSWSVEVASLTALIRERVPTMTATVAVALV